MGYKMKKGVAFFLFLIFYFLFFIGFLFYIQAISWSSR